MPDFGRMIDEFVYSVIVMIAGVHWSLQKVVVMAGYTIKLINQWLIENAFMPIIAETNDSLRIAVSYVFIIALLVLGITYMLAVLVRLDVVSPRNALTWYVAGVIFYTVGPSFYQGMNDFRLNIAQVMYISVLDGMNNNSGDFSSLSQVSSSDLDLGPLCDQFDVYLPGATGPGQIDGLDIAMAYLRGNAEDVMGYPQPVYSPGCGLYLQNPNPSTWAGAGGTSVVPMDWNLAGGYFDHNTAPITWDSLSDEQRDAAVSWAGASQQRALTAWPLLIFALIEQVVHLLITIAMGITFVSFGIAILFAFFKRTEAIAQNIINQWVELIVQTIIIALIQALVIGFFLAGAATGSTAAIIGIGMICLVFILITMWSGIKAVWNSFNRLFNAMSQVTGGVMVNPGTAALATAGAGAVATVAAVGVGSSALAGMASLTGGWGNAYAGSQAMSGATRAFTPDTNRQRERSDYHAEMVSEEMEQHLSGVVDTRKPDNSASDRLEQAADALIRAAQQQRVTGVSNVASVMGGVVERVQTERGQSGQALNAGIGHLQVADRMASVMGIEPQGGVSPIQSDLSRFGLFVDQALRLGLTPQQAEQVVREVQASPEGRMGYDTRDLLDKQVESTQNVSWVKAREGVDKLEHSARMLPSEITAHGTPQVNVRVDPTVQVNVEAPTSDGYDDAMSRESAMGGSGDMIGGGA